MDLEMNEMSNYIDIELSLFIKIILVRDPKQCGGTKGYETSGCDDDEDTQMRAHMRAHIREHIYESTRRAHR